VTYPEAIAEIAPQRPLDYLANKIAHQRPVAEGEAAPVADF
jgi:hypothetical protein